MVSRTYVLHEYFDLDVLCARHREYEIRPAGISFNVNVVVVDAVDKMKIYEPNKCIRIGLGNETNEGLKIRKYVCLAHTYM